MSTEYAVDTYGSDRDADIFNQLSERLEEKEQNRGSSLGSLLRGGSGQIITAGLSTQETIRTADEFQWRLARFRRRPQDA